MNDELTCIQKFVIPEMRTTDLISTDFIVMFLGQDFSHGHRNGKGHNAQSYGIRHHILYVLELLQLGRWDPVRTQKVFTLWLSQTKKLRSSEFYLYFAKLLTPCNKSQVSTWKLNKSQTNKASMRVYVTVNNAVCFTNANGFKNDGEWGINIQHTIMKTVHTQ